MSQETETDQKNNRLVVKLLLVALLMFGFGFALVPLYDVLCDITGQNIKLQQAADEQLPQYGVDESREITVEFITAVNEKTPMQFKAETRTMKVNPGKYYTVNFQAKNLLNTPIKAQAIPSITPGLAEAFFKKVKCFCFETQTFQAHEEKVMPVRFVVDPKLPEQYKIITLSYTFFDRTNIIEN